MSVLDCVVVIVLVFKVICLMNCNFCYIFLFSNMRFDVVSQVIDLDLPITVKLSVVDVDPGLKGDTAQGDAILFLLHILALQIFIVNVANANCSNRLGKWISGVLSSKVTKKFKENEIRVRVWTLYSRAFYSN